MAVATSPSSSATSSGPVERGRLPQCDSTARIAFLSTLHGVQRASAPNACRGGRELRGGCKGSDVTRSGGTGTFTPRAKPSFLRGDPTLPDGVANQVGGVVDVELFHQPSTMKLRRFHAGMQHFRALLRRFAFAHELQDLALARRQIGTVLGGGRRASVDDCLRGAGTDVEP